MSVNFYLLPKTPVGTDADNARDWLDREQRQIAAIPRVLDPVTETRQRKLADLLLKMKPDFEEFHIRRNEIAEFEKISADQARLKYRYIEISGPGVQFTVFDHYIAVAVYAKMDADEVEAILAALSYEGGFVLYDPQASIAMDLSG